MFDPALASRCIFCLEDASTAPSVAHVISESLIEGAPTLSQGAECDRCNNRLSKVEAKFMNDYLGAVTRVIDLEKTKKGRPPSARWEGSSFQAVDAPDGRRTIQIRLPGPPPASFDPAHATVEIPLPSEKPVVASRFMCKAGIEALRYFEFPSVFDARLDTARGFAIDPKPGVFIPYAWRLPNQDPSGFSVAECANLSPEFAVPLIIVDVPGLVLATVLVPMPQAKPFLDTASASGWRVRDSPKKPKDQVFRINLQRPPRSD